MWAGQIAALAPWSRVIVRDMRGYGESDCPDDPAAYSEALQDLEARGFAALGQSGEVGASRHRSALGLAGAARGMLAQADGRIIDSLDKIAIPSLVLVGADDKNFLADRRLRSPHNPRGCG